MAKGFSFPPTVVCLLCSYCHFLCIPHTHTHTNAHAHKYTHTLLVMFMWHSMHIERTHVSCSVIWQWWHLRRWFDNLTEFREIVVNFGWSFDCISWGRNSSLPWLFIAVAPLSFDLHWNFGPTNYSNSRFSSESFVFSQMMAICALPIKKT